MPKNTLWSNCVDDPVGCGCEPEEGGGGGDLIVKFRFTSSVTKRVQGSAGRDVAVQVAPKLFFKLTAGLSFCGKQDHHPSKLPHLFVLP
jgi:hypothetical protein